MLTIYKIKKFFNPVLSSIAGIRHQIKDPNSPHRRIALGFGVVGLYVILAKFAGAAREIAMAWRYGVSPEVDTFLVVFNIFSWPISIWFSVLMVIVVPIISREKLENPAEVALFQKEYLGLALIVSVLSSIFCLWMVPDFLLNKVYSASTDLQIQDPAEVAQRLSFMVPVGVMAGALSAWIVAIGGHSNTLFDGIPALVSFLFLLIPSTWLRDALIMGTLTGFLAQLLVLIIYLRSSGYLSLPDFGFNSRLWRGFAASAGIILIGQALMGATGIIDQAMASNLGPGSVATLSYANRIIAIAFSLAVLTITRAILPVFSEASIAGDHIVDQISAKWTGIIACVGLAASLIAIVLAEPLVKFMFQRGAFSPEDTSAVAHALKYGVPQIPFYLTGMVLYSSNAARGRHLNNSVAMIYAVLAKLLLIYPLFLALGIKGIQLSNVAMYVGFWLSLKVLVGRETRRRGTN